MTIDQMWERLAQHQPYADQRGYGEAWARMCEERTADAAWAASNAAAEAELAMREAELASCWLAAARAERAAAKAAQGAEAWAEAVEWIEKAEGRE